MSIIIETTWLIQLKIMFKTVLLTQTIQTLEFVLLAEITTPKEEAVQTPVLMLMTPQIVAKS